MDSEFPNSEAKAIAALAWSSAAPEAIGDEPAFVQVPEGYQLETLEARGLAPWRPRAAVSVADVASFVEYVKRHGNAQSVIFANDARIASVLNFRGRSNGVEAIELGSAGHGDDVLSMRYVESPEWKAWTAVNDKRMTHAAFAEWLEEHVGEIVEPAGASLLEIAMTLQIKRDAEFRSGVRLQSGAQSFSYQETDGPGQFQLPAVIAIGIPPFEGSPKYKLEARIRYRLEAGKLALWFSLVRPDLVLRAEREERIKAIREALPGVPVYLGSPKFIGCNVPAGQTAAE